MLDKQLNRLPDKYRTPLVLCGLEGRTEKGAAGQLELAQGTLSSRPSRARAMLAKRLARRGVELSLPVASAHVPTVLLDSTMKAASQVAAGQAVAAGIVSAQVAAPEEGVQAAMLMAKLKLPLSCLLFATALGGGAGVLTYQKLATQPPNREPGIAPEVPP